MRRRESSLIWVLERPRRVIAAFVLVGALGLAGLPLLRFDHRPDSFLPRDHDAYRLKRQVEKEFGLEDPMLLAVFNDEPGGVYRPQALRLIQRLSAAATRIVEVYPDHPPHPVYSLATEQDVEVDGGLLHETPFLEPFPETAEDLATLRSHVARLELYDGVIVASDGSAGAIVVVPPPGKADEVYAALEVACAEHRTPGLTLHLAGEAAVRSKMGASVARDALRLNPLCVAVIAAFLFVAFRSLTGVLLPLVIVGWGCVVMLGAMAFLGSPIYIITNAILVTVVSLGVADSIPVLAEYFRMRAHEPVTPAKQLSLAVTSRLFVAITYTSVTDMAGFFSLLLTGLMPPLESFGLFATVGCGATLLGSLFVLPVLLGLLDPRLPRRQLEKWAGEGRLQRWLVALGEGIRRRHRSVATVGFAVLALTAVFASQLRVDQSMLSAFDETDAIVQADRAINAAFHGTYFLDVLVDAGAPGAILEPALLRRIEALEAEVEKLPFVRGSLSVAGFARKMNQILHGWDVRERRIPDEASTIREQFSLLDASPSKRADLLKTVDATYRLACVRFRLSTGRYIEERPVVEAVQRLLAERFPGTDGVRASLAGRVNMDYHWIQLIVRSNTANVICSLVIVVLCLLPLFRSVAAAGLCVLPVVAAILATYALMAVSGIPLGIGTSMFASLASGVGVNFPIHVLDRLREAMTVERLGEEAAFRDLFANLGKALLFNALSVCFGFAILVVSDLPLLRHFGLMIAMGIGTACIASLTLLPAVVAWWQPRFLHGAPRPLSSATRP